MAPRVTMARQLLIRQMMRTDAGAIFAGGSAVMAPWIGGPCVDEDLTTTSLHRRASRVLRRRTHLRRHGVEDASGR